MTVCGVCKSMEPLGGSGCLDSAFGSTFRCFRGRFAYSRSLSLFRSTHFCLTCLCRQMSIFARTLFAGLFDVATELAFNTVGCHFRFFFLNIPFFFERQNLRRRLQKQENNMGNGHENEGQLLFDAKALQKHFLEYPCAHGGERGDQWVFLAKETRDLFILLCERG